MTFGHGVFDHSSGNVTFGASQSFEAEYSGGGVKAGIQTIDCGYPTNAPSNYTGETAIITTGRDDTTTYEVYYSSTKTGLAVQNLPTLTHAKDYAKTYDPTGYWSDHTSHATREDARFSAWSQWSECVDGSQSRTRSIIPAVCHGKPAIGQVTEHQCCPEDAVLSEWGAWGDCIDGMKTRTRTVTTEASCGGVTGDLEEEMICGTAGSAGDTTITTQSTAIAIAPAAGMSPLLKMGIVLTGIAAITFFVS